MCLCISFTYLCKNDYSLINEKRCQKSISIFNLCVFSVYVCVGMCVCGYVCLWVCMLVFMNVYASSFIVKK